MKQRYNHDDIARISQLIDSTEDLTILESDLLLEFGLTIPEAVKLLSTLRIGTPSFDESDDSDS